MSYAGTQYLVFTVSKQLFALSVEFVSEIRTAERINAMVGSDQNMKGVTNLRGNIVPILSLHERLGTECDQSPDEEDGIWIIGTFSGQLAGFCADSVIDVVSIPENDIKPLPEINAAVTGKLVFGVTTLPVGMVSMVRGPELIKSFSMQ